MVRFSWTALGDGSLAEAVAPASYLQAFMAIGKRECPNPGWNMLLPWRLRGHLDRSALAESLNTLVRRHEVLRTTFADAGPVGSGVGGPVGSGVGGPVGSVGGGSVGSVGGGSVGGPFQVVHPPAPLDLPELDLRASPADARAAELDRVARARHGLCLDHVRGPLCTATLVRAADDDNYLLVTLDHAISDGWSVGVILAELSALYNGIVTGRGERVWPLPVQYRDYAIGQRRLAAEGAFDGQLDYWAERLAPDPAPLGLRYRPRPAGTAGYRSGQRPLAISAPVAARLRGLGQRHRATPFMTLLAALAAVLARHSDTGEVAVTTLAAGRGQVDHQRLVGMFANPVVLRTPVAGATSFAELLDRVRHTVAAAYGRQDAPFPLVAEKAGVAAAEIWLNVAPRPARSRFRDLDVDTQALPRDYPIDVPAVSWRGETLICNLTDTGDGIVGLLDYNTHVIDGGTVEDLAEAFLGLLRAAAADPSCPLPPHAGTGLYRSG